MPFNICSPDTCIKLLPVLHILSKKSSAQMGFQANPVLPMNCYILCYISLFTEIIFATT